MSDSDARIDYILGKLGASLDVKRKDAYAQYGYPRVITFDMFYRAYRRSPGGSGAVSRILDKCWQTPPRIKDSKDTQEEPGAWEITLGKLLNSKSLRFWSRLRDFDRRNMVGRYSALILQIRDGQELDQPVKIGHPLEKVYPLWESQVQILNWDEFGNPLMFQYQTRLGTDAQPTKWVKVHPDRVVIFAEGASEGDLYDGVPLLEAGFNRLIDMDKILGGSGESFLKNSARTVVFEFDKEADVLEASGAADESGIKDALETQAKALNNNQDASVTLQGGKAYTLQTMLFDPTGPWMSAATEFAASVRMPFTTLFGQQTGRLASDEDKVDAAMRCQSRRVNDLTPMVEDVIQRLVNLGCIDPPPSGNFVVVWDDLLTMSDKERLDLSKAMAEVNKACLGTGDLIPFSSDEIRQAGGYAAADNPA